MLRLLVPEEKSSLSTKAVLKPEKQSHMELLVILGCVLLMGIREAQWPMVNMLESGLGGPGLSPGPGSLCGVLGQHTLLS